LTHSPDPRDELYRLHAAAAFRRAQRLLGSEADADEVVHDVFVALFERPEQQREALSMSAYFYAAVTHACLNLIRNRRTRQRLTEEHERALPRHDAGTGPELSTSARILLANLPEKLAQLAVYHYLDELSHAEIAQILGCSRRHVGDLLARLSRLARDQELLQCRR
jgi:RNA polymerase sigma factor (sigma-70 family)